LNAKLPFPKRAWIIILLGVALFQSILVSAWILYLPQHYDAYGEDSLYRSAYWTFAVVSTPARVTCSALEFGCVFFEHMTWGDLAEYFVVTVVFWWLAGVMAFLGVKTLNDWLSRGSQEDRSR
jgi:hypothetical protein